MNLQEKIIQGADACERNPENPDNWLALCELLYAHHLFQQAHDLYLDALRLHPGDSRLHIGLGNVFNAGDEKPAAEVCYQNALKNDPDSLTARYNLAVLAHSRRDFSAAITYFQQALRINPAYIACYTPLMHLLRQCCRWSEAETLAQHYRALVAAGEVLDISPFSIITLPDATAAEQKNVAERYTNHLLADVKPFAPVDAAAVASRKKPKIERSERNGKIRLGFLSADFFHHATGILLVRLLELIDRNAFELMAYSNSPDDGSVLRRRMIKTFAGFYEIAEMSDEAVAQRMRDDRIDILIDLKGFTQNSRSRILGYRPAPVQISYLGYPATMDSRLVDYLIADEFVIPQGDETKYAEKILRLPFCYQPNDNLRQLPLVQDRQAMRRQAGFSDNALVLGVFQQNYKLHPQLLSCWADILRAVPAAVLWSLYSNEETKAAIEQFFVEKGISAERLFWGQKVGQQDHLDRLALVDLVLDSWPVNGHTSTADALWAATPVLTLAGDTFISRVAGSLLHAVQLPECVTHTPQEYTARAIEFCTQRERLAAMREQLNLKRNELPLFDSQRYARDFEQLLKEL